MKNKGIVIFFLVVLVAIVVYFVLMPNKVPGVTINGVSATKDVASTTASGATASGVVDSTTFLEGLS